MLASTQGDVRAAVARVQEADALAQRLSDPAAHEFIAVADGFAALVGGDPDYANKRLDAVVDECADLTTRAMALALLARAHESRGDADAALACNQRVLELSNAHGESVFRSWALWSIGIERWRKGDRERATEMLKQGLQVAQQLRDARTAASYLEVLAWLAAEDDKPKRAAVMLSVAEAMGGTAGNYAFLFPDLPVFHKECDQRVRNAIGARAHDAACEKGRTLRFDDAVSYALREG